MSEKFLGSTHLSSKLRATIVKKVAEKMDLHDGDMVMFYEAEDGSIVIRKG